MKKAWTDEEKGRLRRIFPLVSVPVLLQQFPGRTYNALYSMAQKLGIERARSGPPWPGMIGGRHAYGLSEEEWREHPETHHKHMIKKYFGGSKATDESTED